LCAALCPLLTAAHGTFDARLAALNEKLALRPDDAALHFNLAELYCEHEEPTKALAELDRVESLNPGNLPVDYLRGMCLRLAGEPVKALVVMDRFVAAHPDNAFARLQRARIQSALGNVPACLDDYRAVLRCTLRPEPDLVQETADALAKNGFADEALRVIDAALFKLGSIPSLTLRAIDLDTATGRIDSALSRIETLQKTAPRPEPWMARRAILLAQASRPAEARAAWQALLAHLSTLPNLERGSHSMSLLAEQARLALAALDASAPPASVPTEAPSAPPPSRRTVEGARYEEELDRMDRLIAAAPDNAELRFQRAYLLFLDGQQNESRVDCDAADRLAPGLFATDRIRGQLLAAEGQLDTAKALLDRHLGAHADDGLALAVRGRVLMKLKQTDAAFADFRAALVKIPSPDADLYQEVATAFGENGHRAEAAQVLAAALSRLGNVPSVVMQALDLQVAMGDFDAALARVDAMQKSSPRPEAWMARRATLLIQAGRIEESRAAWIALRDRIAALPNLERGSPALRTLAEQASQALASR
jgi:tetratricopeptide (TPR) repeat protein